MSTTHLRLIHRLMAEAEAQGLPLWLQGGWALDARLRRITREHEDLDLAFPQERRAEFTALLASLGGGAIEETQYGFLIPLEGILLDAEPCVRTGEAYELEGLPPGSCPWDKQGSLEGQPVRCVSWEAILWDYFHYRLEVPQSSWRAKDFASYSLARAAFGEAETDRLHQRFKAQQEI